MTLLDIIRTAAPLCDVRAPSSVVGNPDRDVALLLALADAAGQELARTHPPLQALVRQCVFSAVPEPDQGDLRALAPGFQYMIDGSLSRRDGGGLAVRGPLSVSEWQEAQAEPAGLDETFVIIGSRLLLYPAPPAGRHYGFAHVGGDWVIRADGTAAARFAADTDAPVFDQWLLTLGLVLRWKKHQKLDFTDAEREYAVELARHLGRDGGKPTLSFGGEPAGRRRGEGPAGRADWHSLAQQW